MQERYSQLKKRNDVTQIYCHCCTLLPLISLLRPVLLEAVTAAQTAAGQAAIMGYLNFDEEYDFRLQERYLLAAAFSTHPTENLVKDMFVSVYYKKYLRPYYTMRCLTGVFHFT